MSSFILDHVPRMAQCPLSPALPGPSAPPAGPGEQEKPPAHREVGPEGAPYCPSPIDLPPAYSAPYGPDPSQLFPDSDSEDGLDVVFPPSSLALDPGEHPVHGGHPGGHAGGALYERPGTRAPYPQGREEIPDEREGAAFYNPPHYRWEGGPKTNKKI